MGLETGDLITSLNEAWPDGATDDRREGDDHFRLIKHVLRYAFTDTATSFQIKAGTGNLTINQSGTVTVNGTDILAPVVKIAGDTMTGPLRLPVGSASAAALQIGAADTGLWVSGSGASAILGATIGASTRFTVAQAQVVSISVHRFANGVVGGPSISFTNDTTSGLYRAAAGDIRMAMGGADVVKFLTSDKSSTFSGPVVLAADPVNVLDAVTKQYADNALALKAPLASPALTGTPTAPTATGGTNTTQIATTAFVSAAISASDSAQATADNLRVLKSGDTMTGQLSVKTNFYVTKTAGSWSAMAMDYPAGSGAQLTVTEDANNKYQQNFDATSWTLKRYPDGGGNFNAITVTRATGEVSVEHDPTVALGVATKQYVDNADALKAPLASPVFTGNPTAPTPTVGDNDTSVATTAFVTGAIATSDSAQNTADLLRVLKAGDTMTGALTVAMPSSGGLYSLRVEPVTGQASFNLKSVDNHAAFIFDGPNGFYDYIDARRLGETRWRLILKDNTPSDPDDGSNTGSNFKLEAWADGNTKLHDVLIGTRSTGLLTVAGNPTANLGIATKQYVDSTVTTPDSLRVLKTGDTLTGNLLITPTTGQTAVDLRSADNHAAVYLTKGVVGAYAFIEGRLAPTKLRWRTILGDNTAESGSNAGSNFRIEHFADDGTTLLGTALTITRSTGLLTVKADPTAALGIATKQYVDNTVAYNMVVNPTFEHDQENGVAGSGTNAAYFADQWVLTFTGGGTMSGTPRVAASPGPLSGGHYCGRMTIGTADTSIAANDLYGIFQKIEGLNIAELFWGDAPRAKPAILRFEVLPNNAASLGTYFVSIRNAAADRSYVIPFTVSNASGWTAYEFVIPPCTDGTWPIDNTQGMWLSFMLAVGTTYHAPATLSWQTGNYIAAAGGTNGAATSGNGLYIGNVGLYADIAGTGKAPPWTHPDFQTELQRCQRYFVGSCYVIFSGYSSGAGAHYAVASTPTAMRTTPTLNGTNSTQAGYPAGPGTLAWMAGNGGHGRIREVRTSNAANSGAIFASFVDINARM